MGVIGNTPLPLLRVAGRIWGAAYLPLRRKYERSMILTYHDIGSGGIAPELFALQMDYLHRHARVISLEQLLEQTGKACGSGIYCAITFDDGYEGVYRHALAHMRRYGFTARVYLSTDFIHDSGDGAQRRLFEGRPMLSWQQVREMGRNGIEFGSHLTRHGDLSSLGYQEAMEQLVRSREEITRQIGHACEHFAYPFGRLTIQCANWVREAGYRTAVTTVHRALAPGDDMFRLPRIGIEARYSMRDFISIVRGDWDFIGWLQTLRRPVLRAPLSAALPSVIDRWRAPERNEPRR